MSYNFIGIVIAKLIIAFFLSIFQKKTKKIETGMDEYYFTVRKPAGFITLCTVLTVITTAIYIFLVIFGINDHLNPSPYPSDFTILLYLGLSPFWLVWPFLLYILKKWNIKIENNEVTYTPYFRKKKQFPLKHITRIKFSDGSYGKILTVYHEKRKLFVVEDICIGYSLLVSRLEKGTRGRQLKKNEKKIYIPQNEEKEIKYIWLCSNCKTKNDIFLENCQKCDKTFDKNTDIEK